MAQTAKKPCSRGLALAKFLIFSGLGIFMFFVNVEINGKNVIIIQHIINFVKATCGPVIPYYALAMVAFGAVSPIITKAYKRSTFDLVFTIAKAFGLVIGLMAITGIGSAALMTDDMIPFLWGSLVVPITLSIPLTGIAYVMMLNFGLVEFVGAFMRPIMQKIWKTPGESAIDAIVSFAGGYSLAVLLTSDFYKKGVYTRKQALIISTGFSTVATSFLVVVANTLDIMDHWTLFFFSCAFVTFAVTAITCRIYPIAKVPEDYYDQPAPKMPERSGSLPTDAVMKLCFSGDYTEEELRKMFVGRGGLVAYAGSTDMRDLLKMAETDAKVAEVIDAFHYQIGKEIGAMAAAMHGQVDQIILTGGIAYGKETVQALKDMVEWIAPVTVYPGEDELLALAQAALRVLNGEEQAKEY